MTTLKRDYNSITAEKASAENLTGGTPVLRTGTGSRSEATPVPVPMVLLLFAANAILICCKLQVPGGHIAGVDGVEDSGWGRVGTAEII